MTLPRLLDSHRVRRLIGLALAAKGLLGLLAPRLVARVVTRLSLREVYENPGDLEPRDTYVELIRNASLGLLAFGGVTALRASTAVETETDDHREQAHVEFVPNQAPEEHTEYVGKEGAVETNEQSETAQSEARTATRGDGGTRSEQPDSESPSRETSGDDDGDDIIVA